MKKIIFTAIATVISTFVILTALSSAAHAAGIFVCEVKRTAQERAECTQFILSGGMIRMKKNYERIMASPTVPQKEKELLDPHHRKWAARVERECGNDVGCRYDNISSRNNQIERFMNAYGVEPI